MYLSQWIPKTFARYTRYKISLFKLSACFRLSLYQIRHFIVQTICMFSSIVIPDTTFHCSNYLHVFVYRYTRYEISLFKLSACFRLSLYQIQNFIVQTICMFSSIRWRPRVICTTIIWNGKDKCTKRSRAARMLLDSVQNYICKRQTPRVSRCSSGVCLFVLSLSKGITYLRSMPIWFIVLNLFRSIVKSSSYSLLETANA